MLMLQEGKKRALTAATLNEEAKAATALLKKRKREFEDAEAVLQAKHAIKHYSVEDLGKGRSRGGGVVAKKRRWEVLDRLARLGQGLSPAQSLGHNYIKWWVNGCSCGGQLLVAIAACSWPQSRLGVGMQLRVPTRAE